jgi:hypothetical protein
MLTSLQYKCVNKQTRWVRVRVRRVFKVRVRGLQRSPRTQTRTSEKLCKPIRRSPIKVPTVPMLLNFCAQNRGNRWFNIARPLALEFGLLRLVRQPSAVRLLPPGPGTCEWQINVVWCHQLGHGASIGEERGGTVLYINCGRKKQNRKITHPVSQDFLLLKDIEIVLLYRISSTTENMAEKSLCRTTRVCGLFCFLGLNTFEKLL